MNKKAWERVVRAAIAFSEMKQEYVVPGCNCVDCSFYRAVAALNHSTKRKARK
jgi:hypothetical protein